MTKQEALFSYCLRLGDTSLILGQRDAEWCGHGPFLEEDLALTNIALDLVGQAKGFLEYAGKVEGKGRNEDDLTYHRSERQFFNALIVEQPNGDYAFTILRQFLVDTRNYFLYEALTKSKDEHIAALAAKSLKEVTYHLRHSSKWVERFGNGTEESQDRIQSALNELWRFTEEMFDTDEAYIILLAEGIAADQTALKMKWEKRVNEVFSAALLKIPENAFQQHGSIQGKHSEQLGFILAEMQSLARAYPDAKW